MDAPKNSQSSNDKIFREKVLRARQQSRSEKFVSGFELFEEELVRMRGDIRSQSPDFTPEEVEAELLRRLARAREEDELGFFSATPPS